MQNAVVVVAVPAVVAHPVVVVLGLQFLDVVGQLVDAAQYQFGWERCRL